MCRNQDIPIGIRLRDLIPFIYFPLFPALGYLFKSIGIGRVLILIRKATLFHLCWTAAVATNVISPITLPIPFNIPVFTTRWDQSGFVYAIGIVAWSSFQKQNLKHNSFIRFGFLLMAITQGSRAGLLSVLLAILWVMFVGKNGRKRKFDERRDLFGPILITGVFFLVLFSPYFVNLLPENSSLGRIGLINVSDRASANADGTATGRRIAQTKLINWVNSRNQILLGVGPGVEMVYESGAYLTLSGAKEVRAPHSWLIGSLARFGIIGSLFWYLVLLSITGIGSTALRRPETVWILAIMITSYFGVIIESPFGIIPLVVFASSLGFKDYEKNDYF